MLFRGVFVGVFVLKENTLKSNEGTFPWEDPSGKAEVLPSPSTATRTQRRINQRQRSSLPLLRLFPLSTAWNNGQGLHS